MSIFIFLLLLVLLIVVHECGHFFAAKFFGIRVDEFGVGFPPRAAVLRFGETDYSLNWLPFGGYVRIFGERREEAGSNPRAFVNKSRSVQAAVIVAGVLCNFVFAWFALSGGYMAGLPSTGGEGAPLLNPETTVLSVLPDSPASAAGFQAGDVVVGARSQGQELRSGFEADDVRAFIATHAEGQVELSVMRGEETLSIDAVPKEGILAEGKALGIVLENVGTVRLPFFAALRSGGLLTIAMTVSTVEGLSHFVAELFSGSPDFSGIAGPIGIAQVGGAAVKEGYAAALLLMALISVNLALFNLLPVPGLDGGRLLFIAAEAVRGKALSKTFSFGLTATGLLLLVVLMVLVTYHDVVRIFG